MNRLKSGYLLFFLALAVQITWYCMLGVSYFRTPGMLEKADFVFYYAAGRVAREYGLGRVYQPDLAAVAQGEVLGLASAPGQFFLPNHPPFLYPLMQVFSGLPYRPAYLCFVALLFLLVIAGLPVLAKGLMLSGWPSSAIRIALIGVLLFEPLFMSILKGQDSALLVLGGLLWFSGLMRSDDRLAGLGLSLTLIRPQVAVVLALPFLFRQRAVWWWFMSGGLVLGLYSLLLVGWPGVMDYLHVIALSAGGVGYGMSEAAMFNVTGLLLRLVPDANLGIVHVIGWVVFVAALACLCVLWRISHSIGLRHITLATVIGLLAAPHLHYHDLALLVVPFLALGLAAAAAGRLTVWRAALLLLAASLALLFGEFWDPLRYSLPYLMMLALPVLVWQLDRPPRLAQSSC